MNSKEISDISMIPFIREFVFAIIQSIKITDFPRERGQVINADLVPRTSEKIIRASLKEQVIPKMPVRKRDLSFLVAPIRSSKVMRTQTMPQAQNRKTPTREYAQQIAPPIISQETQSQPVQDYGKITPLLNDPSVSTIECQGAGILVTIIRAGQKQSTRISLSQREIKEILNKVSEKTHIPLLEGVFRAAVDNFSINAVISEIIGSRFVIKKQTAYALLEK